MKQRGDTDIALSLFLLLVVGVGWLIFAPWSCHSKWGGSNLNVSWGPMKGCTVQMPSGRWMPEDRIRDIDLEEKKKESNATIPK
jgi:hypothetical protein